MEVFHAHHQRLASDISLLIGPDLQPATPYELKDQLKIVSRSALHNNGWQRFPHILSTTAGANSIILDLKGKKKGDSQRKQYFLSTLASNN